MSDAKVELLYFENCPSWQTALENLEAVLGEMGIPALVERVRVETQEEAERNGFIGSPSIRVGGKDILPAPISSCLGCRIYRTPEGLLGYPTRSMIREALEARGIG